jgi:hypothetical protein
MEDVLGKLKDIESTLARGVAQIEMTEELLREVGSNMPDTRLWQEVKDPINDAHRMVGGLLGRLEAVAEQQAA